MVFETNNLYTLYLDESGVGTSGNRDEYQIFALGGLLIRKQDEHDLVTEVESFKSRWNIDRQIPLHASAIRAKKDSFCFLEGFSEERLIQFKMEILDMVLGLKALLHACIVSRDGYLARYKKRYGQKTWNMLKSATLIVVERAARIVAARGGRLYVVFERGNAGNNEIIRTAYSELRNTGAPFNRAVSSKYDPLSPETLSEVLFKRIDDKTKRAPLLQVADLCLRPLMEPKISGNSIVLDKLYKAGRLIDCEVSDPKKEGIKYYCFD